MISCSNLTISYDGRTLFSSLSYSFKKGLTFIVGESGSGKSTLLEALLGYIVTDGGSVNRGAVIHSPIFQNVMPTALETSAFVTIFQLFMEKRR